MIGVFDSGLGGLSVLRHLRTQLPAADLLYVADRAHAPYGEQSLDFVRVRAEALTGRLIEAGARMVVIACNTASAAALTRLRLANPATPFVGMEPAVKPAAASTRSGVIGVLATPATFQGDLFASLVDRHANGVTVLEQPCPGWAGLVESGELDGPEAEALVRPTVAGLVARGADTLVLGCTHYPFLAPLLERVAGPGVSLIDPGEAVARQAARTAGQVGEEEGASTTTILVTGPADGVASLIERLVGWRLEVGVADW
jgi:glutamate racemase